MCRCGAYLSALSFWLLMKNPSLMQRSAAAASSVKTTIDWWAVGLCRSFALRSGVMLVILISFLAFCFSHSSLISLWSSLKLIVYVGTPWTTTPYFGLYSFMPVYASFQSMLAFLIAFAP